MRGGAALWSGRQSCWRVDLSGDYNPTRPDCAEVVRTAACAIENKLLRELQDVMFVALSPHEQFLGTPTEGLLAFDPAGRLVAANGRARALLEIADGGRIAFDDLFKDARFGDVVGGPDAADRRLSLTSVAGLRFAARSEPAREARATRAGQHIVDERRQAGGGEAVQELAGKQAARGEPAIVILEPGLGGCRHGFQLGSSQNLPERAR